MINIFKKNMKQSIRLTESDIKRIVKESVNRILREEWESPLEKAKKKRNDFDNVKKIDVSKFEKKSKKPKAGTFGDLPSFAKLKNRKDESRISKTLKETLEPAYPGSNSTDIAEMAAELYEKINDCFLRDRGEGDWDFEVEQAAQENPKEIYNLMAALQRFLDVIYDKNKR